jgi:hypothetical protein
MEEFAEQKEAGFRGFLERPSVAGEQVCPDGKTLRPAGRERRQFMW